MNLETDSLPSSLEDDEIGLLLRLYYLKEGSTADLFDTVSDEKTLQNLMSKNLISTTVISGETMLSLTETGLDLCGSMMFSKTKDNTTIFHERIQVLPQRAVSCLINRILWRKDGEPGLGLFDFSIPTFPLDESLWFERVLLQDDRMKQILGGVYVVLESVDLIKEVDGQWWYSPEVEAFLKQEYTNTQDLTWFEEDSLKYYFFFYLYAQDQKNLIDFNGDGGETMRSRFFDSITNPVEYWLSTEHPDVHSLADHLGLSEKRIKTFLEDMKKQDILNERFYALSSSSFFTDDETLYVIEDIKAYMKNLDTLFLTPVVDSLVKK